jgi:Protein of unknown function (DUF3631)
MTGRNVIRQFGDKQREKLDKLFHLLGSDNVHESDVARIRIDDLLSQFDKSWADIVELLGGKPEKIDPTIIADVVGLGDDDPDVRAAARRNLDELLKQHQTWNGLVDALMMSAPWLEKRPADPEPIPDLLPLLDHLLREYLDLREHEFTALALWILSTHRYRDFAVMPRLALCSPVPGCGKTAVLNLISRLAAKAIKLDSVTAAAIYHTIDAEHPTLLLDEVDNLELMSSGHGRMKSIFNSGHARDGTIAIHGRTFSVYCPMALALPEVKSGLPPTLNSRCLTIFMQRSPRELRRYDKYHPDKAPEDCYQYILAWARDAELDLNPRKGRNRLADNWRPLISVADNHGWGEKARAAMAVFAADFTDVDVKILLLGDVRMIFDASGLDRLPSMTLLVRLLDLDDGDGDWGGFRGVRSDQQPHKLKITELASMLREFGIRPHPIWPPNRHATKAKSARGYKRSQFEEAWRVYCKGVTPSQSSKLKGLLGA